MNMSIEIENKCQVVGGNDASVKESPKNGERGKSCFPASLLLPQPGIFLVTVLLFL